MSVGDRFTRVRRSHYLDTRDVLAGERSEQLSERCRVATNGAGGVDRHPEAGPGFKLECSDHKVKNSRVAGLTGPR